MALAVAILACAAVGAATVHALASDHRDAGHPSEAAAAHALSGCVATLGVVLALDVLVR
jgi:hypothetical protein